VFVWGFLPARRADVYSCVVYREWAHRWGAHSR